MSARVPANNSPADGSVCEPEYAGKMGVFEQMRTVSETKVETILALCKQIAQACEQQGARRESAEMRKKIAQAKNKQQALVALVQVREIERKFVAGTK